VIKRRRREDKDMIKVVLSA
jgi:hypothetical protein